MIKRWKNAINSVAILALATCMLMIPDASSGDDIKETHRVPKVTGPVTIDGRLDEAVWASAVQIEADVEVSPGENIPAETRTVAYLAYDNEYLYAGFYCYDPDPSLIRAHMSDRDDIWDDDWILILFDTFNDQRRCYDFLANPLGIQADGIESPDWNEWDAIWESGGRIVDDGYIVEMAIPFTQLRFQSTDEDQVWSFDVVRNYPRNVQHRFGVFPRDRNNNCYLCQSDKLLGFKGVASGRNIEITPTVSMGGNQERVNETSGPFENRFGNMEPGITTEWGVTPNMTLSATINPDFSQVESDAMQMDINTKFSLDYDEKRPFFLEGSDYFDTGATLVHTRMLSQPEWGVKLTGKEGRNTIGFFTVRDRNTSMIFPEAESSDDDVYSLRSQNSVLRYRRDIGEASTVGGIVTDREATNYHNRLVGLDGNIRLSTRDDVQFIAASTDTRYPGNVAEEYEQRSTDLSGSAYQVKFNHNTRTYYFYGLHTTIDADFRSDMGFITQVDNRYYEVGGGYNWRREAGSWFNYLGVYASKDIRQTFTGRPLHNVYAARVEYNGPKQSNMGIYTELGHDWYERDKYRANIVNFWSGIQLTPTMRLNFNVNAGDGIDYDNNRQGDRLRISPNMEKKFGSRFEIYVQHTWQRLDVYPGRLFTANLSFLRMNYQFTERMFLRTIFQYSDYHRDVALYIDDEDVEARERCVASQVLLSYKINPQTVFYLGYSDNFKNDENVDLIQTNRAVFTKLGYALSM